MPNENPEAYQIERNSTKTLICMTEGLHGVNAYSARETLPRGPRKWRNASIGTGGFVTKHYRVNDSQQTLTS